MREVVIVSACRTPFDKFGGAMKAISSIELAVEVLKNVVERVNVEKSILDEVYMGVSISS